MTEGRREGQGVDAEDERLRRPEGEVKDLEVPPEEAGDVRGGLDGGSKDSLGDEKH